MKDTITFSYENGVIRVDKEQLQSLSPQFKSSIMDKLIEASAVRFEKEGKSRIGFCTQLSKYLNKKITYISERVYNKGE